MEITSFGSATGGYVPLASIWIARLRTYCREWVACSVLATIALMIMADRFDAPTVACAFIVGFMFGVPVWMAYRLGRFIIGV